MIDLGASINIMSLSLYKKLNLGPMKETRVIIQLANRSTIYPEGLMEDMLVKVRGLIFPVDFYIIDMESDSALNETNMPLGRPFLKTAKTLIDMEKGTLSLKFAGETITFDVNEATKYPKDSESVCHVSIIDNIVQENFEANLMDDKLNVVLMNSLTNMDESVKNNNITTRYVTEQELANLDTTFFSDDEILPSEIEPPEINLKKLPKNLKHVANIVANHLNESQGDKILKAVKKCTKAFELLTKLLHSASIIPPRSTLKHKSRWKRRRKRVE
jgi:hypothetical protein